MIVVSTILWANLANRYVWIVLGVTLGFGLVGLYDDYLKITNRSHTGVSGRTRIVIETLIAVAACMAVAASGRAPLAPSSAFAFFKQSAAGWFFLMLSVCMIVGAANAIKRIAIVPAIIAAGVLGMIAYLAGNVLFADYLHIHYVAGTGELVVLCGAVVGAGLGFFRLGFSWFNARTSIFMGDAGSLALGAMLGAIAVATTLSAHL